MAAITAPSARLEAGFVWADALAMLKRDWPICCALTAVLGIAPQFLVQQFVLPRIHLPSSYGWLGGFCVGWATAAALETPFACVLIGMLLTRFASGPRRTPLPWGECVTHGCRRALPLYPVRLATDLLTTLGFVLLVVPGVLLTLIWSVIDPVVVTEGASPLRCFGRSYDLTRGYWGKLLIFWLLYVVVAVVVGAAVGLVFGVAHTLSHLSIFGAPVRTMLLEGLLTPFGSAGAASLFRELKILKEGADTGNLATVFD
jgi:hypothetical protein